MNLARIVAAAHAKAPRSRVTLKNPATAATTIGWALGVPAAGGSVGAGDAEAFAARATTMTKAQQFVLLPAGLAFAPQVGFEIHRGTEKWTILGVSTLNPTGAQVLQYRVMATT